MIIKPLISEKTMKLAGLDSYTFLVEKGSTKTSLRKEINERFSVEVIGIKTVVIQGKRKVQRSRKGYYSESDRKKAIVTLKKGQKIALFEEAARGGEEEVKVETAENTQPVVKEKKSLLKGTKVRIEKGQEAEGEDRARDSKKHTRQQPGKTKGEK